MLLTKMAFWRQWKRGFPSYLVLPYFFGFSVLAYFLAAAGCPVPIVMYCFRLFSCLPLVLRLPLLVVITVDCRVSVSGWLWLVRCMDEGTLKTPIPKCRLFWSFLFGVVKQFIRFWIWSETECKTPAEYDLQHNSTPPPPPPHSHTLSVFTVHLVWEGGGVTWGGERGEVREKVERHQHTNIVPLSTGATVHKLGWKYQPLSECISSLENLLNSMPQSPLTGQF